MDKDKKIDKELEFLRGMEKLQAAPVVSPDYQSPLSNEINRVKGSPQIPKPVSKIKNATDKIDTKGIQKIGNAADVMKANADKIARMKALRGIANKTPMLGAVVGGLGALLGSENASAADFAGGAVEGILPESEPTGPELGSLDDRLEKGQLTPEELDLIRKQMMGM